MARFRKATKEKLQKRIREKFKRGEFNISPEKLCKAGKLVSPKAKLIWMILDTFNPCFLSYKEISNYSGYRNEAISNAIEELEIKCMVEKTSGYKHRESNVYRPRYTTEWELLNPVISPSQKHRAKKREKLLIALINANCTCDSFDNRNITTSIIEVKPTSIIEEEPNGSVTKLNNQTSDASRQRCPTDRSDPGEAKGVGLSADDITKPGLAELKAKLEKLRIEDGKRKKGLLVVTEKLQFSCPS